MLKHFLTVALLLALFAGRSEAQQLAIPEVMNSLDRAKNAHAVGDNISALEAIWEAQQAIWNHAPLAARNVAFVTTPPEIFGLYTPKQGENFSDDDTIVVLYFELFGFTQVKAPDGTYGFSLTISSTILSPQGDVVGVERNPTIYEKSGFRTFNAQGMFFTSLNIRGLPPGAYVLKLTIQDNNDPTKVVELEKRLNRLPDSNPDAAVQ
ncbi:MAG: hypothetical protein LBE49_05040 [Deltaproteobacteria bacterium]|jgi:hypothetical protein|nr:hypothetical protein [Deltaproteobacteria bacterium]